MDGTSAATEEISAYDFCSCNGQGKGNSVTVSFSFLIEIVLKTPKSLVFLAGAEAAGDGDGAQIRFGHDLGEESGLSEFEFGNRKGTPIMLWAETDSEFGPS